MPLQAHLLAPSSMNRTVKSILKKSINNVQPVFFDTNVVTDAVQQREPFANDAAQILRLVAQGYFKASVCATTVTTLDNLATKFSNSAKSRKLVACLISLCDVADVNKKVLLAALAAPMNGFEDAVIAQSAIASGIPAIITRNGKDFIGCGLNVFSPGEWLAGYAI